MTQDAVHRTIHQRVLAPRRQSKAYLLDDADFRFAAECERMRSDRNGSPLALLLIRLPSRKGSESDLGLLGRILEGRLRLTDTPGLLADGRVAVLLPDTTGAGAWKVAADVSEVYPPGPDRPECEVLVYPPRRRERDEDQGGAANSADEAEGLSDERLDNTSEFFFAKGMPLGKRALDMFGALAGLVGFSPVIGLAAVAIKCTSPGPVFFSQEREGRGGRRFRMWKLRTMCVDAEEKKLDLLEHSEQDGPAFKMRRDPRTFAVGRFLRWTSLDELPQFWNVLRGDMSLVGPRPLPTAESQACQQWQRRRLDVKPGMTCTWQVFGRGKVLFDDWVRMDLDYAKRHSVWRDLKLILATGPSVLFHRGMR